MDSVLPDTADVDAGVRARGTARLLAPGAWPGRAGAARPAPQAAPEPAPAPGRPAEPRRRRAARAAWALAAAALLLPAAGAVLLALALQDAPALRAPAALSPEDIGRAVALARAHDPRRALPGVRRVLLAGERDLALLLDHGAQRWLPARMHVALHEQRAEFTASVPWTLPPSGRWLNVRATLRQTPAGLPELAALRVGALPVPPALAGALLPLLPPLLAGGRALPVDPAQVLAMVQEARFAPGQLALAYAWDDRVVRGALGSLLAPDELERLLAYQRALAAATWARPGPEVALAELMPPLFALARQRGGTDADAALENRAALLVLAAYANGRSLQPLLPPGMAVAPARPLRVLLAGRRDFPLHFLVSAALVTEGSSPLAAAVGLHKELADARGGSGFSFNDMAANLAGMRFGELALREPHRLQRLVAGGLPESQFMPQVADLPEFLAQPEFERRFGGVGAPAYAAAMADIEQRVAALPLFRRQGAAGGTTAVPAAGAGS